MSTGDEFYTVAEAAQALGVSEKTVRRRIAKGELPAEKVVGPYGPQYRVPVEAIQTAQQIVDVVQVDRRIDPRTLGLVIGQAIQAETKALQEEIAGLRAELAAARAEMASTSDVKRLREAIEARDQQLLAAIRERQEEQHKRRRWPWQWW